MQKTCDELPTFYPVNSESDLMAIKDFQIENIIISEEGRTNIILKREIAGKGFVHREIILTSAGKYLSEEY